MSSPFVTLAAVAAGLFVVVLVFTSYVIPYLNSVQAAIGAIGR